MPRHDGCDGVLPDKLSTTRHRGKMKITRDNLGRHNDGDA